MPFYLPIISLYTEDVLSKVNISVDFRKLFLYVLFRRKSHVHKSFINLRSTIVGQFHAYIGQSHDIDIFRNYGSIVIENTDYDIEDIDNP